MPLGPYRRVPYSNESAVSRMTDLIRGQGDIQARDAYARAQNAYIWGEAINTLGKIGTATMQELAKQPERDLQKQELAERTRAIAKTRNLEGVDRLAREGGLDPLATAKLYEQEGYRDEAAKLRTQHFTQLREQLTLDHAKFQDAQDRIDQAQNFYVPVLSAKTPEAKAAAYVTARAEMAKVLPPALASQLPEAWTPELDEQVTLIGQKFSDVLKLHADTAKRLADAAKEQRTSVFPQLAAGLAKVDSQEDYDYMRGLARQFGASEDELTAAGLGPTFDAEKVSLFVATFGKGEKGKDVTAGSFEDYVTRLEKEGGKPLTSDQVRQARARWEAAGRKPEGPGEDGPKLGDKATAERWRQAELTKAEDAYVKATTPTAEYTPDPATVAAAKDRFERRKKEIDVSYYDQLGAPNLARELQHGPPPAPPPAASMADLARNPASFADVPMPTQGPRTGLLEPGNIGLAAQPRVRNPDGSISTVRSMSFQDDRGREVLIPTVVGNRVVSDREAIQEYERTGRHLGIFDTPANATAYAKQLHEDYAAGKYGPLGAQPQPAPLPTQGGARPETLPAPLPPQGGAQARPLPNVPAGSKGVRSKADVIARGRQLVPPLTPEEAIADAEARGYLVR